MGVVTKPRHQARRIGLSNFLAAHLLDSERARSRFLQEALAISAMNHPSIAIVYEAGEANGEPFLALEYLGGGTLRMKITNFRARGSACDRRSGGPLITVDGKASPTPTKIRCCIATSSRQLMFNAEGKLKITDFGLARFTSAHITKGGVLSAPAPYMSPEQAQGHEIDQRSDLFAAGP